MTRPTEVTLTRAASGGWRRRVALSCAAGMLILAAVPASAQVTNDDLLSMSLEALMDLEVSSASGVAEALKDAPSTMIVVTADQIRRRGYDDLVELLQDLPGFDISVSNGAWYMAAAQRGYRTSMTQGTLLLVDGKVDNHLYTHNASISRQYPIEMIDRVEVLYGPSSVVYGANAFLGVINILTKSPADLADGDIVVSSTVRAGSWATRSADLNAMGRVGGTGFSIAGRAFVSDEADLSDRWGFLSNAQYADTDAWGPLLDLENNGRRLGSYYDPSRDLSLFGRVTRGRATLGAFAWDADEGYGAQYPGDRAQNNGSWINSAAQAHFEYEADPAAHFRPSSALRYRRNFLGGDWVEATPDWNPGMEPYSWVSFTNWRAEASSWTARQEFELDVNRRLTLSWGAMLERKRLTRAYDIPGYWGAFSSSVPSTDPGPHGFGDGVGHSLDATYTIPALPADQMPEENLVRTTDLGGHVQAIYDLTRFRFHGGLRFDHNSLYGGTFNPRLSVIFKATDRTRIKAAYGEAFQAPAPIMLWGGWSGRNANEDLQPEKVRHAELIGMWQAGIFLQELSVFHDWYDNVIKEEAENAGERTIYGFEYRLRGQWAGPWTATERVESYLYYSYVKAMSSLYFDGVSGEWLVGERELGDAAPHKVQAGVTLPLPNRSSLFVSGSYTSDQKLYLRNPLRLRGDDLEGYVVVHAGVQQTVGRFRLGVRVKNLFDARYFHSGVEAANAGDDFTSRSLGWQNSVLPQPGRSVLFSLSAEF